MARTPIALAVALGLALAACSGGGGTEAGSTPPADDAPASAPGDLPDEPFETSEGATATFADFVGRPMVVNFFASWCPPCRAEMPDFEAVHQAVGDRVRFLGLDMQDTEAAAHELADQTGITYEWGFDPDGSIYRALEGFSMPTTLYVSPEGVVLGRDNGPIDADALLDRIEDHFGVTPG